MEVEGSCMTLIPCKPLGKKIDVVAELTTITNIGHTQYSFFKERKQQLDLKRTYSANLRPKGCRLK